MSTAKPNGNLSRFVLDTSAVLTYTGDEPGAETVGALLTKASHRQIALYVSCVSMMEAGYKAFQARGEDGLAEITAYLDQLPVIRVDVTDELILQAARMMGTYRLSLADAWILATARSLRATLVHKDPEFEPAADAVTLQALPYR